MERVAVQDSGNLASVGYDPEEEVLEIEFKRGNVYRYKDVPEHIHRGLMNSESRGRYFREHIAGSFSYEEAGQTW